VKHSRVFKLLKLLAVAVLFVMGIGFWENDPARVQLALAALAPLLGMILALRSWMQPSTGPLRPVEPSNVLAPPLVLGGSFWLLLQTWSTFYPVPIPAELGVRERAMVLAEVERLSRSRVDNLIKVVASDQLPADVKVVPTDQRQKFLTQKSPEALLNSSQKFALVLSEKEVHEMEESRLKETRDLIQKGLRWGRRDPAMCGALAGLARKRGYPREELNLLKLLHRTRPPSPQPEREAELEALLHSRGE
jgi:hypothetical protein